MPHRLNAYLASDQALRQLSSRASQLTALQRLYESIAPPNLARSSQIIRLHQHTLVIAANNGAIAAKLRQMSDEFISCFQARGCEVTGIQIKVQVTALLRLPHREPRHLGSAARKALLELEDHLADSPLKKALGRLAKR